MSVPDQGKKTTTNSAAAAMRPRSTGYPINNLSTKQRKRRQFIFDHLWGVPGGINKMDLKLLRSLQRRRVIHNPVEDSTRPFILLDEIGIAENKDLCCNHGFGRTAREFAWHSSVHGLKYTVFSEKRLADRVCWGLIFIISLIVAIVLAVRIRLYYDEDPVYFSVEDLNLEGHHQLLGLPPVSICPQVEHLLGQVDQNQRRQVELKLPPMFEMWQLWDNSLLGKFDPEKDRNTRGNLSWASDSANIHRLMDQVMIEGGILSLPTCQQILSECSLGQAEICCQSSELELTQAGPCYKLRLQDSKPLPGKRQRLGHFIKAARQDLNLSLTLSGTTSARVGFPIVTANYFGSGYLCSDHWGQTEAEVMCKSLGFTGGERFYMDDHVLTFPPTSIVGQKISCQGNEESIFDCPSSYDDVTGQSLQLCQGLARPVGLMCDQVELQLGSNLRTKTRGLAHIKYRRGGDRAETTDSYFCASEFDDVAAQIFCQMLSWPQGRAITLFGGNSNYSVPEIKTNLKNLKCIGTPTSIAHVLDCSHDQVTGHTCEPAAVECGPGFPLTLRFQDDLARAQLLPTSEVAIGYPVIDTTNKAGYICDKDQDSVNAEAVLQICKYLGFGFGTKLPGGLYGQPSVDHVFVMESLRCTGDETSLFSCQLGPWGQHPCPDNHILTIMCTQDESKLTFDHVMANPTDLSTTWESSGVAAISTSFGLVPVCGQLQDQTPTWTDREADVLCRHRGFSCGMVNRTLKTKTPNDQTSVLNGVFASVRCDHSPTSMAKCNNRFFTNCPSDNLVSVVCLNTIDSYHELCTLLRSQDSSESHYRQSEPEEVVLGVKFEVSCSIGCNNSKEEAPTLNVEGHEVLLGRGKQLHLDLKAKVIETNSFAQGQECQANEDYDKTLCVDRCKVSLVVEVCQCIPWHLARVNVQGHKAQDYDLCQDHKVICASKLTSALEMAPHNLSLAEIKIVQQGLNLPKDLAAISKDCTCPDSCLRQILFDLEKTEEDLCPNKTEAKVHLKMNRLSSMRYRRRPIMTKEVMLGAIGGIMAILCGLGFIWIFEIFYFFIIRLWDNLNDPLLNKKKSQVFASDWSTPGNKTLRRTASDTDLIIAAHCLADPTIYDLEADLTEDEERPKSRPVTSSRLTDVERAASVASLRSRKGSAMSGRSRKSNSALSNGSLNKNKRGSAKSIRSINSAKVMPVKPIPE